MPIGQINAIGGGAVSPIWTQIISDVTGRKLHIVEHPLEAGAMGAALAVAVGMGVYPNMEAVDDLIAIKHVVEPQSANASRYQHLYRQYRDIYDALVPVNRHLHDTP